MAARRRAILAFFEFSIIVCGDMEGSLTDQ
jgi:hypothetical protein